MVSVVRVPHPFCTDPNTALVRKGSVSSAGVRLDTGYVNPTLLDLHKRSSAWDMMVLFQLTGEMSAVPHSGGICALLPRRHSRIVLHSLTYF